VKSSVNIVIAGVGGQGAITTSSLISRAVMRRGINVITSETHGMAQRGGSVEVHVRIGDVHSPQIPIASADYFISMEAVEVLRYAHYLNDLTKVIINKRVIKPPSAISYPSIDEIVNTVKEIAPNIVTVNATEIARKSANAQAVNVVLTGMLAYYLKEIGVYIEDFQSAIKEVFPERIQEKNIKALYSGYNYIKEIKA